MSKPGIERQWPESDKPPIAMKPHYDIEIHYIVAQQTEYEGEHIPKCAYYRADIRIIGDDGTKVAAFRSASVLQWEPNEENPWAESDKEPTEMLPHKHAVEMLMIAVKDLIAES